MLLNLGVSGGVEADHLSSPSQSHARKQGEEVYLIERTTFHLEEFLSLVVNFSSGELWDRQMSLLLTKVTADLDDPINHFLDAIISLPNSNRPVLLRFRVILDEESDRSTEISLDVRLGPAFGFSSAYFESATDRRSHWVD